MWKWLSLVLGFALVSLHVVIVRIPNCAAACMYSEMNLGARVCRRPCAHFTLGFCLIFIVTIGSVLMSGLIAYEAYEAVRDGGDGEDEEGEDAKVDKDDAYRALGNGAVDDSVGPLDSHSYTGKYASKAAVAQEEDNVWDLGEFVSKVFSVAAENSDGDSDDEFVEEGRPPKFVDAENEKYQVLSTPFAKDNDPHTVIDLDGLGIPGELGYRAARGGEEEVKHDGAASKPWLSRIRNDESLRSAWRGDHSVMFDICLDAIDAAGVGDSEVDARQLNGTVMREDGAVDFPTLAEMMKMLKRMSEVGASEYPSDAPADSAEAATFDEDKVVLDIDAPAENKPPELKTVVVDMVKLIEQVSEVEAAPKHEEPRRVKGATTDKVDARSTMARRSGGEEMKGPTKLTPFTSLLGVLSEVEAAPKHEEPRRVKEATTDKVDSPSTTARRSGGKKIKGPTKLTPFTSLLEVSKNGDPATSVADIVDTKQEEEPKQMGSKPPVDKNTGDLKQSRRVLELKNETPVLKQFLTQLHEDNDPLFFA